tara:strand:+ start:139 stop:726 length:588 start_codon:yes stop_codon:yes gene_type:complete
MKNYFYNLPVEIQQYIFDINKSDAVLKARFICKNKYNYLYQLILDLLYNSNPTIKMSKNGLIAFKNCIFVNPYTIRILNIMNENRMNIDLNNFIHYSIKNRGLNKIYRILWFNLLWGMNYGLLQAREEMARINIYNSRQYFDSVLDIDKINNLLNLKHCYLTIFEDFYDQLVKVTQNTIKNISMTKYMDLVPSIY